MNQETRVLLQSLISELLTSQIVTTFKGSNEKSHFLGQRVCNALRDSSRPLIGNTPSSDQTPGYLLVWFMKTHVAVHLVCFHFYIYAVLQGIIYKV